MDDDAKLAKAREVADHRLVRGVYFETFGSDRSPKCKEHSWFAPDGDYRLTLPLSHIFGPVHRSDVGWKIEDGRLVYYAAALVPSKTDRDDLSWVNIWSSNAPTLEGVMFAWLVPRRDVEGWRRNGWVDRFVAPPVEVRYYGVLIPYLPSAAHSQAPQEPDAEPQ